MKKFIVLVLISIIILITGCNKTVPNLSGDVLSNFTTSNDDGWGLLLSASNVTPKGLTIICIQGGGSPTGSLQTGSRYWLEKNEDEQWVEVKEQPRDHIWVWTLELRMIPMNDTVEWEVNWEGLYGELSAGEYRIGKEIEDFRSTGDYDEKIYYVAFEIK